MELIDAPANNPQADNNGISGTDGIDETDDGYAIEFDLKYNSKRLLFWFILFISMTVGVSFVYIYLEECYDPVPPPLNELEQTVARLCHSQHKNRPKRTQDKNNTALIEDVVNLSSRCNASLEQREIFAAQLEPLCSLVMPKVNWKPTCEYSISTVFTYYYMVLAITHTIGNCY